MRGLSRSISICALAAVATLVPMAGGEADPRDALFQDRLFQQCINWMLDGSGGSMIDNRCADFYGLPPPSLFLCARKVLIGFASENDREVCAVVFDEQARKARAGYVK